MALSLLVSASFGLEAKNNSWTGVYCKIQPGYSNLNSNYTGEKPYRLAIRTSSLRYFHRTYSETLSIKKVSASTFSVGMNVGGSYELTESIGIIGEIGVSVLMTSNFLDGEEAKMYRPHLAAGLFFAQPSFRIYGMAGIGYSKDIFGYPNCIENLATGNKVSYEVSQFLNSTFGLSYRGSVGVDFKVSDMLLLGVEYSYNRSATTVNLKNDEKFYLSSHSVALNIGAYL